jgi:hypothetical protein
MRPFILPSALLLAAVILGGVPGFLLGFVAVAMAFDRALDFEDASPAAAFRHAARGRAGTLAYLPDNVGWAATAARRRLGVVAIPVASIIGTTDAGKAESWDASFRPPPWCAERWGQLWLRARRGEPLPPIAVYRVGDRHYVRDGHHRVSVARALGTELIDAAVVELRVAQPSERIVSVAHSTAS